MSAAYYNEIDPYAAQWLRNLIDAGHIAPGVVDTRNIEDVHPRDLDGFTQCHFFAGIGVWSYALRLAGWPDDRPVWTGSCPCQPFSSAGKGAGFADERHLWPAWHHLIRECRPAIVFGEQVASSDVGPWLDLVQDDLEAMGHAFGAVAFPSAGVGAPHIRDRLFWVAHAEGARSRGQLRSVSSASGEMQGAPSRQRDGDAIGSSGAACELGDAECQGLALSQRQPGVPGRTSRADAGQAAERAGIHVGGLADHPGGGWGEERADSRGLVVGDRTQGLAAGLEHGGSHLRPGPTNGYWRTADWIACRDGKWRPVEPGAFPLADGPPARVGRLRAYGNAINAQAAAEFVKAAMGAPA